MKNVHNWRRKKAEYCRKQFNTRKSFQQHVQRFHIRPQAAAGTSTGPPTKVARTDGDDDGTSDELEGGTNLAYSLPGDPVSTILGMNIRYWKCPHCNFKVVKWTAMELHWRVTHPDGPAMSKITTELEMDLRVPFPEVQ